MRKLFILWIAACMLCAGCAAKTPPEAVAAQTPAAPAAAQPLDETEAPAETAAPTPSPTKAPAPLVTIAEPIRVETGETKTADLNGDGEPESVSILAVEDDPNMEPGEIIYYFVVTDSAGKETLRQASEPYSYRAYGYIADIDADGSAELFFCQTYMSDDFSTKCYRCEGDAFRELYFLDQDDKTRIPGCYALIDGFCDNGVRVSAYVNVLGTRIGQRAYLLDGDVFAPAPDALWDFCQTLPVDDADTWEYYALKTAKALPVVINGKRGELPARTKLLLTGTDAKESAAFITKDGVEGVILIAPDEVNRWGWAIAGEPEQDWFAEPLPYAG